MRSKDSIAIFNIKLKRIKKYFRGWGSNLFGHNKKRRQELKNELSQMELLEESVGLSPEEHHLRFQIQVELFDLYSEEEAHWFQKAHGKWLLEGDLNTSYFHRIANGRRRKNSVQSLQNGEILIEGIENLIQHATEYYKELFGPAPGNMFQLDPNLWSLEEKISEEDNIELSRPFTIEEVKYALFSMETNKAPGPDNIPVEFYQHCWEVVKNDIMRLFLDFYNNNFDVQRLNYGVITLLPKMAEANRIQQFRPICLLRCIYKLITKTLCLRLDPYASKLFSVQQNAFIKGRNILDGIMSLHEIMHHMHVKKKTGIILKLDFEKAYDKVN